MQCDRLFEEIERADARGLDRSFDRGVAGHHHDRHRQLAARGPFLEQRDAIGVGHPDVEQHEVWASALTNAPRIACALGERNLVTLVGQDLGEELADADFVVDDQDLCHG